MNRIGARGRGESVVAYRSSFPWWREHALAASTGESELLSLAEQLNRVLEQCAWDGRWYLRAYDDAGNPVCGGERIDAVCRRAGRCSPGCKASAARAPCNP